MNFTLLMLVCPQCQFENPNSHKFCQKCGTSLTHKSCHECGTSVVIEAENCPNCGAFTGTVWWAIVAEQENDNTPDTAPAAFDSLEHPAADSSAVSDPTQSSQGGYKLPDSEQYLDPGRRYRLIATDGEHGSKDLQSPSYSQVFQGKVVDCQPLQKSVLEVLLEQETDLVEKVDEDEETVEELDSPLWHRIWIPELALPYLSLQDFSPPIPEVHDAWQEGSKEVILLCDRSDWQLLSQCWDQNPLPTWQIIEHLVEMLALWKALSQVHCCQSLLLESNLRINEDETFG
ncbi:MAG: double zinc ribbon domain-containing protein, partial [Microcystaceae cyanobacterium]